MNNIYYIDDNTKQQFGPFQIDDLRIKNIRPNTMVWASGMPDWTEARNIPELHVLFSAGSPPLSGGNRQGPPSISPTQPGYTSRFDSNVYGGGMPTHPVDAQGQMMPKSWLAESIILTILCCSPISIVGIYFASKVSGLYRSGDYYSALEASKNAKIWTLLGIGISIAMSILSTIMAIADVF